MIDIVLIRHAPTAWNEQGLYQGRTDIPLSEAGIKQFEGFEQSEKWKNYRIFSSPLVRATQTANLLFPKANLEIDSRLIEMDFGSLEGTSIEARKENEDYAPPSYGWRGWDSGPSSAETYAQVATRFLSWVEEAALLQKNVVAITHKGVILAAMGLAYQWDMKSKRPFKIKKDAYQVLTYSKEFGLKVRLENQSLS
ncbi:histidine phosphatase family protein [Bdellovibrio svalbardensis]|uniref:Histidine phosphatase family protein n=1 Tax=Bdellovibrio svalbardensis TaxID=2972972 RepID=A0ABT6DHG1_9BACT|nr:histidine phosphatase family protein [Bdellovibrio svalbardensis]MDG0816285.1 histidine phosphatase family protein [Bdellovibrio svalbardensis]